MASWARRGAAVELLTVLACDPASTAPAGGGIARGGFATEGESARGAPRGGSTGCAVLGATPVWLPFGSVDYDRHGDETEVRDAVLRALEGADVVLVPGFPLSHPDHAWLVRSSSTKRPRHRAASAATREQPYTRRAERRSRPRRAGFARVARAAATTASRSGARSAATPRSSRSSGCEEASGAAPSLRGHSRVDRLGAGLPFHVGMKLVMTLLVRDEADVVDAQIAYHLDAGVDFVVATDNRSQDGTTEILERYERDGVLHLIREPGDDLRQSEWVTRMARLAATDFGADWILNADADEFWHPRGGSFEELFAAVPERFGAVRGAWRTFVPRPDDGRFFAERMTARLCTPSFHPHPLSTHFKSAHRARPDVRIGRGNHEALAADLVALRGWYPIEILHFPVRSLEQCRQEVRHAVRRARAERGEGHPRPHGRGVRRLPRRPAGRVLRAARRRRRAPDGRPRGWDVRDRRSAARRAAPPRARGRGRRAGGGHGRRCPRSRKRPCSPAR